uniref:Uncharacterized protein n=1 Tax=Nelumbo nucifera TaxID=4432 RepID=A0A822YNU2_NELNU|nr:TPA_asm: hypothetical protein HUJ06_012624 [Nelumbo nucifera]
MQVNSNNKCKIAQKNQKEILNRYRGKEFPNIHTTLLFAGIKKKIKKYSIIGIQEGRMKNPRHRYQLSSEYS